MVLVYFFFSFFSFLFAREVKKIPLAPLTRGVDFAGVFSRPLIFASSVTHYVCCLVNPAFSF